MNSIPIWQMIDEVVKASLGRVSYRQIKDRIHSKWKGINDDTITAQIIALTVNHTSRIHYPENDKPRSSGSKYDLLFYTGRGEVEKYDQSAHGVWEIIIGEDGKLKVNQSSIGREDKIFTPADIVWFKNVTNRQFGKAYLDINGEQFVLNFPNRHRKNILTAKVDEIILIRQKIEGKAMFTHLVTPIDDEEVDDNKRDDYRYGRNVKIIAKIVPPAYIPVDSTLWERVHFGGVTQGNVCKLKNIKSIGNLDELQYDIWERFKGNFTSSGEKSEIATSSIVNELEITNPEIKVSEGKLKLISHLIKERNPRIVKEKKLAAIKNNKLHCEVCLFSFQRIYRSDFIECHHLDPIEGGERETGLDDLALVCSNCHRMLHAKFENGFLTIKALRERMIALTAGVV